MKSPMERTLQHFRDRNIRAGIVERFCHNRKAHAMRPGIRSDLFDIFDVVVMIPGRGIGGIQCCGNDFASHYRKITVDKADNAIEWIVCGGFIEIWSWRRIKRRRGGKAYDILPRVKEVTLRDFEDGYQVSQLPLFSVCTS